MPDMETVHSQRKYIMGKNVANNDKHVNTEILRNTQLLSHSEYHRNNQNAGTIDGHDGDS